MTAGQLHTDHLHIMAAISHLNLDFGSLYPPTNSKSCLTTTRVCLAPPVEDKDPRAL